MNEDLIFFLKNLFIYIDIVLYKYVVVLVYKLVSFEINIYVYENIIENVLIMMIINLI